MPFVVTWLIPDRVILSVLHGAITGEEIRAASETTDALRTAVNARVGPDGPLVHTFNDARAVKSSKADMKDLRLLLGTLRPARSGWSVYVNESIVDRFFIAIAHQVVGAPHLVCRTAEAGLNFLLDQDTTLPRITLADLEGRVQAALSGATEAR